MGPLHVSHLCSSPLPLLANGKSTEIVRCYEALSFTARLVGLLATGIPESDEALLIPRCHGVHGWGMPGPLECLFLSSEARVIGRELLLPGRALRWPGAQSVIECRLGALPTVMPGVALSRNPRRF